MAKVCYNRVTMFKPIEVKALPKYHLWIRFSDGVQGEADLSHLVGQGVFSVWKDPKVFQDVRIGEFGELIWNDAVDLCPDSLYLQITGKTPEQVFPNLNQKQANA